MSAPQRIQKVLAEAGLGSRREIERWIVEGRVVVNGRPARLGDRLLGSERVMLDGRPIKLSALRAARHSYRAYYKPAGEASARRDPEARRTIFDQVKPPKRGRWVAVGLELNASGLVLLTTDGVLADRLTRPGLLTREYAVRLTGAVSPAQLRELCEGVQTDDGPVRFAEIVPAGGTARNTWYRATVEDAAGDVRAAFQAVGLGVGRLICVRLGPVALGDLHRSQSRSLRPDEVSALYESARLRAD